MEKVAVPSRAGDCRTGCADEMYLVSKQQLHEMQSPVHCHTTDRAVLHPDWVVLRQCKPQLIRRHLYELKGEVHLDESMLGVVAGRDGRKP